MYTCIFVSKITGASQEEPKSHQFQPTSVWYLVRKSSVKLEGKMPLLKNKKGKKGEKKKKKEEWAARLNKSKATLLTCKSSYFLLMREYGIQFFGNLLLVLLWTHDPGQF